MNLKMIPYMARSFMLPVGLSDHTPGITAAVTAVALGACIIEKHLNLSRSVPGPDSAFSLEPEEFKAMVQAARTVLEALGGIGYGVTRAEIESRKLRRSLFIVRDMAAGQAFSRENIRSIRPAYGLSPGYIKDVLGKKATRDIKRGTPLSWELVK
jgi:N-acetylneuraminate synthase